ncbi:MAG TPA: hypothetical protein VGG42_18960 [Acidobacteriaceae bacterium]
MQAAPPNVPSRKLDAPRRDYSALFAALQSTPNTWLAVDPGDIGGNNTTAKQGRLHIAARIRGMKIQVTTQNGVLFIRTLDTASTSIVTCEPCEKIGLVTELHTVLRGDYLMTPPPSPLSTEERLVWLALRWAWDLHYQRWLQSRGRRAFPDEPFWQGWLDERALMEATWLDRAEVRRVAGTLTERRVVEQKGEDTDGYLWRMIDVPRAAETKVADINVVELLDDQALAALAESLDGAGGSQ